MRMVVARRSLLGQQPSEQKAGRAPGPEWPGRYGRPTYASSNRAIRRNRYCPVAVSRYHTGRDVRRREGSGGIRACGGLRLDLAEAAAEAARPEHQGDRLPSVKATADTAVVNMARTIRSRRSSRQVVHNNCRLRSAGSATNPARRCSTLWNGQDFKQAIDPRQGSSIAVLADSRERWSAHRQCDD